MSRTAGWDLACFSYLAHAHGLHVDRYPHANTGTAVTRSHASLAGDGPITATVASQLGARTVLVSNQIAPDPPGHAVTHRLKTAGVHHAPGGHTPAETPYLTVVTDGAGTRTWFAHLTHAHAGVGDADLNGPEAGISFWLASGADPTWGRAREAVLTLDEHALELAKRP